MSARKRLYEYIKQNGIKIYPGEELRAIGQISEWARVLRQLNQDNVIKFTTENRNYYITEINEYTSSTKRKGLSEKDKYRIRNRDGHRCQACGKGVNDGVTLEVDHKIPLEWGGTHNDDNLWVLCNICNNAKKAFFKDDFDPEVMVKVFQQHSGYAKLKTLFENSPGKKFSPSILQGIAGIRDWTRTIRDIRNKYNINITWNPTKSDEYPNGYYVNESL